MATRKQRRKAQKSRRHEYEVVYVDDEGNEVAVDEIKAERREREQAKAETRAKTQQRQPARGGRQREVKPPSWRRVGKRALLFAPGIFIVLMLVDRGRSGSPVAAALVTTLVMMAVFLPFSYVMDSLVYRAYVKRTGGAKKP